EPMKLNQPNSIIAKNSLDYSPEDGEMPQRMSGIPAECSRVILCFAGQSFQKVAHNELFPIWAATSISRGGLGFDSVAIGGIMSFCGVALLIIQPLLYRRLHDRVGTLSLYRAGRSLPEQTRFGESERDFPDGGFFCPGRSTHRWWIHLFQVANCHASVPAGGGIRLVLLGYCRIVQLLSRPDFTLQTHQQQILLDETLQAHRTFLSES
ncbi:hypothetical protein L0F63_004654, partial [Massospora cicadina]